MQPSLVPTTHAASDVHAIAPTAIREVFIVDDDYDMREALTAMFRRAGYPTAAFTDGLSFVRLARDQTPACVLIDLCMPGYSGIEVLKELDASSYPAPVLVVSGLGDCPPSTLIGQNGWIEEGRVSGSS